jgi:hypothetical protein
LYRKKTNSKICASVERSVRKRTGLVCGFLIQRLSDVQIDARVSDGQRADTNCGFVLTGNTENYIGTGQVPVADIQPIVPLREPDCDRNSGRFLTMWQRCTCVVVEKGC